MFGLILKSFCKNISPIFLRWQVLVIVSKKYPNFKGMKGFSFFKNTFLKLCIIKFVCAIFFKFLKAFPNLCVGSSIQAVLHSLLNILYQPHTVTWAASSARYFAAVCFQSKSVADAIRVCHY